MRKLAVLLAVAVAAGAIAVAPTVAQTVVKPKTTITAETKVVPNNAGTPKNPQGVKIKGSVKLTSEEGIEPPIVTDATVYIGKGGVYNGGKYPKCTKAKLDRAKGPSGCPKHSIMGKGSGSAKADNVDARPSVVFVNGGAKKLLFWTTLYNPAFVQEVITAKITKVTGKWRYKVRIVAPKSLQVVVGVPIALRSFKYSIGGKRYAKEFIATTSCPKGNKYSFQVVTNYLYFDDSTSTDTYSDTTPCRK